MLLSSQRLDITCPVSSENVMDTLRSRRHDRPPHLRPPRRVPKPIPRASDLVFAFCLLGIFLQFATIFILIRRNRSLSQSISVSSPPSKLLQPTSLTSFDVHVTIYSYDRPRHLFNLLSDIAHESDSSSLNLGLHVIDDNSYACVFPPVSSNLYSLPNSPDPNTVLVKVPLNEPNALPCTARHRFAHVEKLLMHRGWHMYVSKYRHARRRYWHLVAVTHALLLPISSQYFLFLPDDDRLAHRFFDKVLPIWDGIRDSRKLTMMLHVEESRENVSVWTDFRPKEIAGGVLRIGWVESGNFICGRDFLRFVNWSFPPVPVQRWVDNANISSGVGATLSERIHAAGKRMFLTKVSFVAHVGVSLSKMNAEFREKRASALLTKYFSDGDDVYQRMLDEAATVTASIASQWSRESALHSAVESLAHQVDRLNVYLNNYDSVPPFLRAPYVTVLRSQERGAEGDIGDVGKFFWCNDLETEFHVTADDDIIYPPDYVTKLLEFWRGFRPPVVVGVHGIRIKQEDLKPTSGRRGKGYYGSREVWMAIENVPRAINVHIVGTGTMLYRPSDVGYIDIEAVFQHPNMADVWFGLLAQRAKLPMMIIPHVEGWIREVPGTMEDSIYKRSTRTRRSDRVQTHAAQSIEKWELHGAVAVNA